MKRDITRQMKQRSFMAGYRNKSPAYKAYVSVCVAFCVTSVMDFSILQLVLASLSHMCRPDNNFAEKKIHILSVSILHIVINSLKALQGEINLCQLYTRNKLVQ